MIYLFHDRSGETTLTLDTDSYKHMIKARRHEVGDIIRLRHKDDDYFYYYRIESISKKDALLFLEKKEPIETVTEKKLHIGWAQIDPKSVEKVLPALCELGVTKITFIQAKRSQQNYNIDEKRLERIILNSMQQSGRLSRMQIAYNVLLEEFTKEYPDALVLDFSDTPLGDAENYETVILGPEGGFSQDEKKILKNLDVRRLSTPNVLRSETAAVAIACKMLL